MRYIIGIDLGTTNSSVAYVDTQGENFQIRQFRIPQLSAAGYTEDLATLPSFCYLCAADEWPAGSLTLPWKEQHDFFVGRLAQVHGAKVPTRLIQSAKSWLCHGAAERKEKIIPFEATDESIKVTPVEASKRYLNHLKEAWNYQVAKGDHTQEFEQQEIVLTVPASFDEVARRLTAEAAAQAGFNHLTLLEEPQAAFYSWLAQHESSWQSILPLGSYVLVCDVGGGTTDFSLIEVAGTEGNRVLKRMSVGDHLLLGGDNMDSALAHCLERELFSDEPGSLEWMQLKAEMRAAKEALLSENSTRENFRVVVQGSGASIVGSTRTATISREEMSKMLAEGFFGHYSWDEALNARKSTGIRTMGLAYESEPSITKHMARFLSRSSDKGDKIVSPDFVLFNGGTMKPRLFQEAIVNSLNSWFPEKKVERLSSYNLDLAVARGAAYYGKVKRGVGVKISGGTARGYYLGLDIQTPAGEILHRALTLLPRGAEEGAGFEPDHTFFLRPNIPVSFQLYTSHVRLDDHSGDRIEIDPEQLQPLPPIHTILRFGKMKEQTGHEELIPVHIAVYLNSIGILEVRLKSLNTAHVWNLEFQLRSASGHDDTLKLSKEARRDELFDRSHLVESIKSIEDTYSSDFTVKPARLTEVLERQLGQPRKEWSPGILRGLCEPLLKVADKRKLTQEHEARWWNLAGFFLLPGCGYPLDDFRIKELWKIILTDSKASVSEEVQMQKWICYRRIAAGFNKGQQLQLAHELIPLIINKKNGKIEVKGKAEFSRYAEKIRALASFELIDNAIKFKIGDALTEKICRGEAISVDYWALGRIGARHLLYGSNSNVVSKEVCTRWIEALSAAPIDRSKEFLFLIMQLARKTDCREINLSQSSVDKILAHFADDENDPEFRKALSTFSPLSIEERDRMFGEHLPPGLLLSSQDTPGER